MSIPGTQVGVGSQVLAPEKPPGAPNTWNYFRSTNRYYLWGMETPLLSFTDLAESTLATTSCNGQFRAQPHVFPRAGILTDLVFGFNVAVIEALTPLIRVGIYDCNPATMYPRTKLYDSGDLSINSTASGGGSEMAFCLRPNLTIRTPGIYYIAWTINAGFASGNGIAAITQPSANFITPWLGMSDLGITGGPFAAGFNNLGGGGMRNLFREGCQWIVQAYSYPATLDALFPGTATTTPISDGSGVSMICTFTGAQQMKLGGVPLMVMHRFTPG